MTSARPTKSAIASATKPGRNTSRAAWTCVSRSRPPPRLRDEPALGRGERRVAPQPARRGRAAAGRATARPRSATPRGTASAMRDRLGDPRQHREAVLGVVDREPHDLGQRQRSVVAQQQHPRVERARHARGEQPGARHELEAEVAVVRDRRRRRAPGPARRRRAARPRRRRTGGSAASPPGPLRCGSTTCSVRPAATAASNAFPPCSSGGHARPRTPASASTRPCRRCPRARAGW